MTASTVLRPEPSALQQWWVLTVRSIVPTLRNGELVTAIAASVIVTAGFYIPLNKFMGSAMSAAPNAMSSYAQFLTPLIVLQGISFASIMGAFRAATDTARGITRRFGSMPIPPLTPLAARLSGSVYRCVIGLVIALICGYVIGFRFHRSAAYIVAFCLLVLLIGVTLSLLADLIGIVSKNPEATTPLLMGPQLILGLLSVGVQPAEQFPEWIQPLVRNQPISQFVDALRALAGDTTPAAGSVTWPVMGPTFAWLLGLLLILVPAAVVVVARRP
jgi:ABC-2 type transport system permease protein